MAEAVEEPPTNVPTPGEEPQQSWLGSFFREEFPDLYQEKGRNDEENPNEGDESTNTSSPTPAEGEEAPEGEEKVHPDPFGYAHLRQAIDEEVSYPRTCLQHTYLPHRGTKHTPSPIEDTQSLTHPHLTFSPSTSPFSFTSPLHPAPPL